MGRKLYKVRVRIPSSGTGINYSYAYVVADNETEAYKLYRSFLDKNNIGFTKDRVLDTIELLAEEGKYSECGTMLLIGEKDG